MSYLPLQWNSFKIVQYPIEFALIHLVQTNHVWIFLWLQFWLKFYDFKRDWCVIHSSQYLIANKFFMYSFQHFKMQMTRKIDTYLLHSTNIMHSYFFIEAFIFICNSFSIFCLVRNSIEFLQIVNPYACISCFSKVFVFVHKFYTS